jgi:hypothetical protein
MIKMSYKSCYCQIRAGVSNYAYLSAGTIRPFPIECEPERLTKIEVSSKDVLY